MMRFGRGLLRQACFAVAALVAVPALGQTLVSGTITGTPGYLSASPYQSIQIDFSCIGAPNCVGNFRMVWGFDGCANQFTVSDRMTLTIDPSRPPGPMPLAFNFHNGALVGAGPPDCVLVSAPDLLINVTASQGTWNGSTGAFDYSVSGPPIYSGAFTVSNAPPVFPMTVTSNIGAAVSSASAVISYRPQDVGTTGSVYVFAMAPATALHATATGGEKDQPVQCVLAQLNASGQLKAVSVSALQAYVTGVLTAQGQAVTILNNAPTANIGGAVFYVGYGPNAQTMMANGINQRAVSIPGASACNPQRPQTGWWWNPAEGGRGYSIEVAGNHLFFAAYLYDVSGRATWLVASGNTSLDGSLYTGTLESYAGGQTLSGPYAAPTPSLGGPITLAFSDSTRGTLSWPGGTIPIERFNIVPNGLGAAPLAGQPQAGWWWNQQESGRGFFLEWQAGQLFMAGYMYDEAGNPVWYLSSNTTPSANLQSYSNNWMLLGNGQTLTGAYRQPATINANVAAVTITFTGPESGLMTLPGGRTTAITRFRF